MFCKKGVLKKFCKNSQENTCAGDSGLLQHRYFPVSFAKILRTHFLVNTSGGLILSDVAKLKEKKNRTHNLKIN